MGMRCPDASSTLCGSLTTADKAAATAASAWAGWSRRKPAQSWGRGIREASAGGGQGGGGPARCAAPLVPTCCRLPLPLGAGPFHVPVPACGERAATGCISSASARPRWRAHAAATQVHPRAMHAACGRDQPGCHAASPCGSSRWCCRVRWCWARGRPCLRAASCGGCQPHGSRAWQRRQDWITATCRGQPRTRASEAATVRGGGRNRSRQVAAAHSCGCRSPPSASGSWDGASGRGTPAPSRPPRSFRRAPSSSCNELCVVG
jgi:hypothetical protein